MSLGGALCVGGTIARVDTLFFATGQGVVAVLVEEALVGLAPGVGVGVGAVVLVAAAVRAVVGGLAEGVLATLLKQARILAFPVDASLIVSALTIALATSCKFRRLEQYYFS